MPTLIDTQERLEQIDRQIIKLLEDRARIAGETGAEGEIEQETMGLWTEEAEERGLDEGKMEKVAQAVIAVSKPLPE